MSEAEQPAPRRRGRRPAGEDARAAIVAAARAEFAERGYEATTLRGIARVAGVDARLVHHYFDGKDEVFAAAMEVPVPPRMIVEAVLQGPREEIGVRLLTTMFGVWDAPGGRERITAIVSSATASPTGARIIREFLVTEIFGRIAASLDVDRATLRASLVGSQMIGLIMARYVVQIDPVASAPAPELVAAVAPTVQRYLTGEL
ncbi:MAG: TetR family transcriptional regulator [Kineosporiaceae bacterium]